VEICPTLVVVVLVLKMDKPPLGVQGGVVPEV